MCFIILQTILAYLRLSLAYFRFAIRVMVVRGAPAIAIAAALALAVEAFNLEAFNGTPSDAASFLVQKLEYLVSRYLAVP